MELDQLRTMSVQSHPSQLSKQGVDLLADFVSHWPTERPWLLTVLGGRLLLAVTTGELANSPNGMYNHEEDAMVADEDINLSKESRDKN